MKYRPEFHLERLRTMMMVSAPDCRTSTTAEPRQPVPFLLWLRTMKVELSHTPLERPREAFHRLALQQRSRSGIKHIVLTHIENALLSSVLPLMVQCVPLLTSFDVRGCDVETDHLECLADAYSTSLRRLYLPWECNVAHSTLDRFTRLEELDVSGCKSLTNVDFCSTTLRELYANECYHLTDAGLRKATRLQVLHVSGCENVTNVSPFALSLLDLNASGESCGIDDAALSNCPHLQVLHAWGNDKITSLLPFAGRLRELHAPTALANAALANATGIVKLNVAGNECISTVEPFGPSLRELHADENSLLDDAGLITATNLVCMDALHNTLIQSLAPFSSSLLELGVPRSVDDEMLSAATNLTWIDISFNDEITTLQSCGPTLRHLVAEGDEPSALANEGVSSATQLVTLNCAGNPNLTTIEPFRQSLEELITHSDAQWLVEEAVPNLHYVEGASEEFASACLERMGFCMGFTYGCYRNLKEEIAL